MRTTIFEQESFYYTCEVEDGIVEQNLDEYESEAMFTLEYVSIEEAIALNLNANHHGVDPVMIERETRILSLLANGYTD